MPPQENDFRSAAHVLQSVFIDAYQTAPGVTADALRLHITDPWLENKTDALQKEVANGEAKMFVAGLGGSVVGYCLGRGGPSGGELAVLPEYRRGSTTLSLVHALGKSLKLESDIRLQVVTGCSRAIGFYNSLGFSVTDTLITTNQLPKLRGGETLPLVEMKISAERARQSMARLEALLKKRSPSARTL